MFVHGLTNRFDTEESASPQAVLVEQVLGPVSKWSAKPCTDRYSETHLRSVSEGARNMTLEERSQRPLLYASAHLQAGHHAPGSFKHMMIEKWSSTFETNAHRRTIDFYQDIIGQVADGI